MIARFWRGWTTPADADTYETLLRDEIMPGIERRGVPGYRGIELWRRDVDDEVEFVTVMWFDAIEAVEAFAGPDYTVAVVPPAARAVLKRFDAHSAHYDLRKPRRAARSRSGKT